MGHALLFEIWENPEDNSFEMSPVTEEGDQLRLQIASESVLRHSFWAKSDFDAYQTNYDWHGWGTWRPEPNWTEQLFTGEQAAIQRLYLATRKVRSPPT
jgi:hypothetical protein